MDDDKNNSDFSVLIFQGSHGQLKLVKTVLIVFAAVLALFEINNIIYLGLYRHQELLAGLLIIGFLYSFVTRDTTNIVAWMLLWTMTILASYTAWENDGLYDTAIIAFPCMLIFASLLCGRLLILNLAAYMLLVFYFFAYAYSSGFIESTIVFERSLWGKANNLAIILIIYGAGISLVSRQIGALVRRLFKEQKRNQEIQQETNNLTRYDLLTKLPNEVLCKKRLDELLENSRSSDGIIGFLTLDLDNFKRINSSYGHEVGDQVFCLIAKKLSPLTNNKIHLFHSSGKEFILLAEVNDYQQLSQFGHQLIQIVCQPITIQDNDQPYEIEITCSMGIAIYPFDGTSFELLRKKSHTALAKAKDEKESNSLIFFEREMQEAIHKKLKMLHELKLAIERGEFELYYQPKVNMQTQLTESVEALIRWHKNATEIISPLEFIPIAEESGLINEIGKWALEQACFDCQQWHQLGLAGLDKLSVAVNLSPVQFRHGNLPTIILRALNKSCLDPSFLELEITESLFIKDNDHIKEQIYQINKAGISIAIDDFGTGYSNLNYLTKFNASTLKIDMSFVKNMLLSEQQCQIVAAIINISSIFQLKNVAEGVEDLQTFNLLKQLGCQYGQGYYWSKPLPNLEFIKWIKLQSK